jgi:Mating-type protein MAT alpha 1 HMG-box
MEAKAYSELRDASIKKLSLVLFLTETVGMLRVIPADQYLSTMGWKLVFAEATGYELVKINPAVAMLDTPLSANLSAADIVKHCYDIGLAARGPPSRPRMNPAVAGVTMSFAARPHLPKIPVVVQEAQTTGTFTDEHEFFDGACIPNNENILLLTPDR